MTRLDLDPVLRALAAALHEEGPAVEFGGPPSGPLSERAAWRLSTEAGLPEGTAVVVRTSGSTGSPHSVALTAEALAASSMATAIALHGEGQWLLTLPLSYVAGVQVLVRSLYAGTRPEALDLDAPFTATAFAEAAALLTDPVRLTSLVPTQLRRLLDDGSEPVLAALRRFDAILLGGGPIPAGLLERAATAGARVVTTYGSAETCGGCVYDGLPLDGVELRVIDGLIRLGGPMIAEGYVGEPGLTAERFAEEDSLRWYLSSDLGELREDGTLAVLGRADDVVVSGGLKISAARVTAALEALDGVREAFAAGAPDPEWGQAVTAAVVLEDSATPDTVASAADRELGRLSPKSWLQLDSLPLLPNGKANRQTLAEALAANHVAHPGEWSRAATPG